MKLLLVSNVTVGVLATVLQSRYEVRLAPGFDTWRAFALEPDADLVAWAPDYVVLILDTAHGAVEVAARDEACEALGRHFPHSGLLVPDVEDLAVATVGPFYDEKMWRMAAQPWSLAGLHALADEIARLIELQSSGRRRKALAVDLDGVLWRGVIGEDGVAGIEPDVAFQRGLRELRERGVILVALSKNNEADVAPVWRDPRMVLTREDFAAYCVNWEEKSENLVRVAADLNLGLEAFVFVDDSPAERAAMRAAVPEVAVADFPITVRRLARLHFPRGRVTAEDRAKTQSYRAETERRAFARTRTLADYLAELEIRTDIHPVTADEVPRVAQLSQKSNQFNVCTNRYTEADVAAFRADPREVFLSAHTGDRFGDLGLVAFIRATVTGETARIGDFVMSCRAMNRRLEYALFASLRERLEAQGVKRIEAVYRPTPRNAPVASLFPHLGFDEITPGQYLFTCIQA